MNNTYLLTVSDPSDPSYHDTYVVQHATRSDNDLLVDYTAMLDAHTHNSEWSISDVFNGMKKMGWKFLDIPQVHVKY